MKKLTGNELFGGMGRIGERFILEASEENIARLSAARRRRTLALRTAACAACVCLAIVGVFHAVSRPGTITPGTHDSSELTPSPAVLTPGTHDSSEVTPPPAVLTVRDGGFEIADGVALSYDGMDVSGPDTSVEVPATVRTVSKATFADYAAAPSVTVLTLTSPETKLEAGALEPLTSLESIIVSDGSGRGVDLAQLLDMTVTDIVNNGCSLTQVYIRYGGSPIYSVGGFAGIELEFQPRDTVEDDPRSPLCGTAKPRAVYVTNEAPRDVTVAPGLYVGMDISEAPALGCRFYDAGEDMENGMVCLYYDVGGYTMWIHMTDVPGEVYKEIFWWDCGWYNGSPDSVSQEYIDRCEERRAEFARSPIGTIFNIEISKRGSTPPWGWLEE